MAGSAISSKLSIIFLYLFAISVESQQEYTYYKQICDNYSKTKAAPGVICGDVGAVSQPNIFKTFHVSKGAYRSLFESCRDECLISNLVDSGPQDFTQCAAFSTKDSTGTCTLYGKPLNQMGFHKGASGQPFSSKDCFYTQCGNQYEVLLTDDQFTTYDDDFFSVVLPFNFHFYDGTYSQIYISTNGFVSFGLPPPQNSYANQALPSFNRNVPATYLPDNAICGFWDDMRVQKYADRDINHLDQYISYKGYGSPPDRVFTVHWKVSSVSNPNGYLEMEMRLLENDNRNIQVYYINVDSSNGSSATIGMQQKLSNRFKQYSFNSPAVSHNMFLNFDTLHNTIG